MPEKILVVEDEVALNETLVYNLTRSGFEVQGVLDGKEALQMARAMKPDLIILDILLPGMDGLEFTRQFRQEAKAPILMLTAQSEEIDRVVGLEVGADDYMTKPFSMRELIARVKSLLRRVRLDQEGAAAVSPPEVPAAPKEIITFGNLSINTTRYEVQVNGNPVRLKPKEYELLLFLVRHRGQVLSRTLILERVWGWDFAGGTRTVDVHVRWLREKIESDPTHPTRIITIQGVGYRFDG